MDKFEKLALEAIEESKGRVYTPQDPYVSFGFEKNPFLEVTIDDLLKEECIESRFKIVIQYIDYVHNSFNKNLEERKGEEDSFIFDGVIYGDSQSGISTLITLAHQYLIKVHKTLSNTIFSDAKELVEFQDNQYSVAKTFQNFRNSIDSQIQEGGDNNSPIIIDHADYLIDFFEDFRYAFDRDFQNTPIIYVFSQSGWTKLKNLLAFSDYDINNKIIPPQRINSLNEDEIFEILSLKLSKNRQIQNPFSKENLQTISKNASGSLLNAIRICSKVCEECFYNGMDVASKTLVHDVTALLAIDVNKDFYNLVTLNDNTQTFILSLIAMKSIAYDFGITYDDIINNLGIQKTSASHHLKQLQEKRYVIKKTVNRKAFYRLRDELKTVADNYLMKRFEQKDTHVRLENIMDLS